MRDEFGMADTPTYLTMVHLGDRYRDKADVLGFANIPGSPDGSTLIHIDNLCVPVPGPRGQEPRFTDLRVPRAPLGEVAPLRQRIVCWRQPSEREQFRACRWAPIWMWEAAAKTYVITKQPKDRPAHEIARFTGILDLSAQFATGYWNSGVIETIYNSTYRLYELLLGPNNSEHLLSLDEDPRLDPAELPKTYREMNILPE